MNKALVRRLFDEAWNQGNPDIVDELVAPDYVLHAYSEDEAYGVCPTAILCKCGQDKESDDQANEKCIG